MCALLGTVLMATSFLLRYRSGECEQVWSELVAMGAQIRESPVAEDANAVAQETMRRVRRNVETVHHRLIQLGYQFWFPEHAFLSPPPFISGILAEIEHAIGPIPLSLRAFYEVVGSVNFCQSSAQLVQWQRPDRAEAPELAVLGEEDPLEVCPVERLRKAALAHGETHLLREADQATAAVAKRQQARLYFCFASDEFHKADYSGGENYHVWLPNADADFQIEGMYGIEEHFVEYLRATFIGGGFRGRIELLPDDDQQCRKVAPQLRIVQRLAADLLPI
jgi:hypothetical protein